MFWKAVERSFRTFRTWIWNLTNTRSSVETYFTSESSEREKYLLTRESCQLSCWMKSLNETRGKGIWWRRFLTKVRFISSVLSPVSQSEYITLILQTYGNPRWHDTVWSAFNVVYFNWAFVCPRFDSVLLPCCISPADINCLAPCVAFTISIANQKDISPKIFFHWDKHRLALFMFDFVYGVVLKFLKSHRGTQNLGQLGQTSVFTSIEDRNTLEDLLFSLLNMR